MVGFEPQPLPALAWPGGEQKVSVLMEDRLSALANRVGDVGLTSKAELVRVTNLPRSTVGGHVDWLLQRGVLTRITERGPLRRGRPGEYFSLNGKAGAVLAVEMGVRTTSVGVIDLKGTILAKRRVRLATDGEPAGALAELTALIQELITEASILDRDAVSLSNLVAVIAFPARVESRTRTPLRPTVVPTWDGFDVASTLEDSLGCPVIVENDCNVRAIGEAGHLGPESLPLIALQIGTGLGAGIIDGNGDIFLGANGSAGDVGHVPASNGSRELCSCGTRGCVETVAAVPAMLNQIREAGLLGAPSDMDGSELLAELLRQRDPIVTGVVREGAEAIGEIVATLCNVLNPRRVVITSALAAVSHDLLAGVRSVVYTRARALATKDLVIDYSNLGENLGLAGAYLLGRRHLLAPERIKRLRP